METPWDGAAETLCTVAHCQGIPAVCQEHYDMAGAALAEERKRAEEAKAEAARQLACRNIAQKDRNEYEIRCDALREEFAAAEAKLAEVTRERDAANEDRRALAQERGAFLRDLMAAESRERALHDLLRLAGEQIAACLPVVQKWWDYAGTQYGARGGIGWAAEMCAGEVWAHARIVQRRIDAALAPAKSGQEAP